MSKTKITVSRRQFVAGAAASSLVMGLGTVLGGCSADEAVSDLTVAKGSLSFSPVIWFEIDGSGLVTMNIVRAEMGQHVGTALAQVIADELGADWEQVRIQHVDTDSKWGYMVTGGSWSVHTSFTQLSQAGAAGRIVLADAGAKLMGVDPSSCHVEGGHVFAGSTSLSFAEIIQVGDIARRFSSEELAALPIKAPADRRIIGRDVSALDVPAKTDGSAQYGLDVTRPGMVYGIPLVPPTRYGSKAIGIDDSAARALDGYLGAIPIADPTETLQGWVVVAAETMPMAIKAASAVQVEWQGGDTANINESDLLAEGLRLAQDTSSGTTVVNDGDVDTALASAAKQLQAVYRTATALHFTLEPQNAVVEFDEAGQCHIYAGNQWQSLILPLLTQVLGLPETDIVIHQQYLGGGYGRRLFGDQMIPAVLAARELGRPLKLIFDREADSRFDCVRSPTVCTFAASFDQQGALSGIDHAAVAGWPTLSMAPGFMAPGVAGLGKFDPFSISGAEHWYSVPAHRIRAINNELAQKTFLPGWLRAVGSGWTGWGVESFMDEIAHELSEDPLALRLRLLDGAGKNAGGEGSTIGGAARLRSVLEDVAIRSNWGTELPAAEGMGVAVCHGQERGMPTWIACVAHVAITPESGDISVKKLWQTIDVGTVVNPSGAMAQAEGAALWGLSLALHEGAEFEQGQVKQRNLDTYTPLRMSDVPELDIVFIDSDVFPSGLGEPPLIPVAPAIGNAVFAATGKRVRDLPIRLS
ncbi:MAG: molybdopterin-dependent oxidoreductase [Luminiphilus sp.]|nr:molybdopterin-dependent oxidoreductase [Luminiphilus sp.]